MTRAHQGIWIETTSHVHVNKAGEPNEIARLFMNYELDDQGQTGCNSTPGRL